MNPLVILLFWQCFLALPVAVKTRSPGRFFLAFIVSFFEFTLPLGVFLLSSSFFTPDSKQGCDHGWLDCFAQGKLALAPMALLASVALYATDVLRVEDRLQREIVIGVFWGAMISVASLAYFIFMCFSYWTKGWANLWGFILIFFLITAYVTVMYSVRAVQLIRAAPFSIWLYVWAFLGSLPFWLTSWVWSLSIYQSLPEEPPPGCFIVTAASRGHARFTGPHTEIIRHGRRLSANQQLLTFWELESRWRVQAPRSHTAFRRIYNQVGPIIAARIRSPWLADAVYLGLKPLEIIARCINGKD